MIIKSEVIGNISTNTYLLIDEKTGDGALIDCPCESDILDEMLKSKELKRLKYIILTHGHYDHIMGVYNTKKVTGAKVLIHSDDAVLLENPLFSLAAFSALKQIPLTPDVMLNDGDVIELGSLRISVIHTPGHTKGSCCFTVNDVMFSGDTLFYNSIGRTDSLGGDYDKIMQSMKKLKKIEKNYIVYPGHDIQTTLDFEKKHNQYMK